MTEVLAVKSRKSAGLRPAKPENLVADPHISVAESARALRISPTTLRRYVKDFGSHLDVIRKGRQIMVAVSSIPTLAQIRDLRAQNSARKISSICSPPYLDKRH